MAGTLSITWDTTTRALSFTGIAGNFAKRGETLTLSVTALNSGTAATAIPANTIATIKPVNTYGPSATLVRWDTFSQVGSTNVWTASTTLNASTITTLLGVINDKANCVMDLAGDGGASSDTLAIPLENNVTRDDDTEPSILTSRNDFLATNGTGLHANVALGILSTGASVAAQTAIALTDNATNYLELNSSGVASSNTSGFTDGSSPLALIVTVSGAITSNTDRRPWIDTKGGVSSGGGGPSWTYTDGAIGDGLFTTSNADISSSATITLSKSVLGRFAYWNLQIGCRMVFTDSAGISFQFSVSVISDSSNNISVGVSFLGDSSPGDWSGKYSVEFWPIDQVNISGNAATADFADDVDPAGSQIAGALSGKQDALTLGTGVQTALGNAVNGANGIPVLDSGGNLSGTSGLNFTFTTVGQASGAGIMYVDGSAVMREDVNATLDGNGLLTIKKAYLAGADTDHSARLVTNATSGYQIDVLDGLGSTGQGYITAAEFIAGPNPGTDQGYLGITFVGWLVGGKEFEVFVPATVAADRTIHFQDASGTIALTSDLPSTTVFGGVTFSNASANSFQETRGTAQLIVTGGSGVAGMSVNGVQFGDIASYNASSFNLASATQAVNRGGTGITSGTSGGILAFTATGTIASSGLLAANALMIGGGAGVAPSTTTTGTGVLTALGINVGSAGAFITFNGNAGTPSALVGTNISGTAASLTAGNATKWTTGRTIALTGDVTYTSGSLDGSGNVTGTATLANIPAIAGTNLTGTGANFTAGKATALATARNIFGQSFDGSGNIGGGTITLAGNLVTTGAFNTTFAQAATTTVTLPSTSSTMARTDAAQTFTGVQSMTSPAITTSITFAGGGSITEGSGAIGIAAGGSNQNIPLTPSGTGQVTITSARTASGVMKLQSTASTGYSAVDAYDHSGTQKVGFGWGNTGAVAALAGIGYFWTNTGTDFGIVTNNSTARILVKSGGNVLIGSTTDASTGILQVTGAVSITTTLAVTGASTLTGAVTQSAKTTTYNGIATVSNGVPAEYATADLTAQSAAKTTTTLYTPAATGMFRVSVYLQITTAASTSSVLGGTTGVVITYNDGDGNVTQTDTVALMTTAGAIGLNSSTNTTATNLNGSTIIYARTGVAIQYAIDYTSVGITAMVYAAHLKLEAL